MDLKQKIQKKRDLIKKHESDLKRLIAQCDHSETIEDRVYYEGNYNDRAHTEIYDKCLICGNLRLKSTKEHSWYG
jgi:hypothetical protein